MRNRGVPLLLSRCTLAIPFAIPHTVLRNGSPVGTLQLCVHGGRALTSCTRRQWQCTLQGGNGCVAMGDVRVSDALTWVEEVNDVVMRISATSCFSPSNATCIGVCPFLLWEDKDTHTSHDRRPHVHRRQFTCRAACAICSIVSWREKAATTTLQKSLRMELKQP